MANSHPAAGRGRWQFRLSTFLLLALALGPLLGMGGPLLWAAWQRRRPAPPPVVVPYVAEVGYEGVTYYESAETPLD